MGPIIWLTSLSAGAISASPISSEERRIIRCCHITNHVLGHCDGCFQFGEVWRGALVDE